MKFLKLNRLTALSMILSFAGTALVGCNGSSESAESKKEKILSPEEKATNPVSPVDTQANRRHASPATPEGPHTSSTSTERCDHRGFNSEGRHNTTGTLFDTHGFNLAGIHETTNTRHDPFGFDFTGRHQTTGHYSSPDGFSWWGFSPYGFDRQGRHRSTGTEIDGFGFDIHGFHQTTHTEWDPQGFNRDELDRYGFDRQGWFGKRENSVYNDEGFNQTGQHTALDPIPTGRNHTAIVLRPDNPADFKNHPLFKDSGGREATLVGQPSYGKDMSLSKPFGNLEYRPNYSGDSPNKLHDLVDIAKPKGMTDTQFINSLIHAAESYKNDKPYVPMPGEHSNSYNSNSFVSGTIEKTGATAPTLPGVAPGYDKPIPRDNYVKIY